MLCMSEGGLLSIFDQKKQRDACGIRASILLEVDIVFFPNGAVCGRIQRGG